MTRRRQPRKWEFGLTRIFFFADTTRGKLSVRALCGMHATAQACLCAHTTSNIGFGNKALRLCGRSGLGSGVLLRFRLMRLSVARTAPFLEAPAELLAMGAPPRLIEL